MNASITAFQAKGPLAIPGFRGLLLGGSLSLLGDVAFMVALPWLVLQMTSSGLVLGSMLTAMAVPRAALMLFGGAISDRAAPKTILLIVNVLLACSVCSVGVLAYYHALALWALYAIAICFGIADAFGSPALRVLVPRVVGREHVQSANSLLQSSSQICMLAGAPVAGLLIVKWGIAPTFFIDAVSYGFLIVALLGIGAVNEKRSAGTTIWQSILDGLQYVKNDAALRALVLVTACINFCMTGATQVGLASIAHSRYGSAADFGLMSAAAAIGSLAGALLAGIWQLKRGFGGALLAACVVLGGFLLSLALPLPIGAMLVALLLAGSVAGYVNVLILSALQKTVESQMLGRVMSVLSFTSVGIAPISLVVSGYLSQSRPELLFVCGGGALLLVTLVLAVSRLSFTIVPQP